MYKTYLKGKITIFSFAIPTNEDLRKINALSNEDRKTLLEEVLERAENCPLSDKSVNEIWHSAMKKAEHMAVDKS